MRRIWWWCCCCKDSLFDVFLLGQVSVNFNAMNFKINDKIYIVHGCNFDPFRFREFHIAVFNKLFLYEFKIITLIRLDWGFLEGTLKLFASFFIMLFLLLFYALHFLRAYLDH